MPELPEVETITQQLKSKIIGFTICNVEVKKERLFDGNPKKIIGLKVQGVRRRAKNIIIDLEEPTDTSKVSVGRHLLIHLKMTGQLIYIDKKGQFGGGHPVPPYKSEVPNKYTHIVFGFSDGSHLYYNDIRQFGWIKIVTSKELDLEFNKFGSEPLDKNFTLKILKKSLEKYPQGKIKVVLMDPHILAGIGNIYSTEICHKAGILPQKQIKTLGNQDFKNLYNAIKKVLPLAIKYKGTSDDTYVTLEGKKGGYQSKLWVYGREGLKCPKCGKIIKKMKLGGRGTYFCPKCQK